MKTITIHLEEKEWKELKEQKGGDTWKDALEEGCRSLSGDFTNKMNS